MSSRNNNQDTWEDKLSTIKRNKKGWEKQLENVESTLKTKQKQSQETLQYLSNKQGGAFDLENITDFHSLVKAMIPKGVIMEAPPDAPRVVKLKDFSRSCSSSISVTKCCYCSKTVPLGGSLINCRSCSVIAHSKCITNIWGFHKSKLER